MERLLSWLDPNREQAEERYGQIRTRLLNFFESNDCREPDRLVQETASRVLKKHRKRAASGVDVDAAFEKAARKTLKSYVKQWAETGEAFERLLRWLDRDLEKAGHEYNRIHLALTAVFRRRGFDGAESLADEAVTRVIVRLPEIEKTFQGTPAKYFSGVAKNLCKERGRFDKSSRKVYARYGRFLESGRSSGDYSQTNEDSLQRKCCYKCLERLQRDDRDLLLAYYEEDKGEKIRSRRDLARRLGITPGYLRVRRHRVYTALLRCIEGCMNGDEE